MRTDRRSDLVHDFVMPTLLFSALGAMAWAVRGCAGAGGMNAHIAPGLIWGTAWWFLARDPGATQSRRYQSGWILLAMTAGFAIAGARGWVQWHHFYDGHLSLKYPTDYVPIAKINGFVWMGIAGAAWAALPACLLAWCGTGRPTRAWEWTLRIACGLGGAYVASRLFNRFPEIFLPAYGTIMDKYQALQTNPDLYPGLFKLVRDCHSATRHVGFCAGFLLFEAARRDWKNVTLISTVFLINGIGWPACQHWKWALKLWPDAAFNFGRCWECSAGVTIGIAYGVTYYLVNRRMSDKDRADHADRVANTSPHLEMLLGAGLMLVIGWAVFWPTAESLGQLLSRAYRTPQHLWGYVFLLTGLVYGVGTIGHYFLRSKSEANGARLKPLPGDLEWWAGLGLMLVLGIFIQNQVQRPYGDDLDLESVYGWLGPGSIYIAVVLAYAVASYLGRISSAGTEGSFVGGEGTKRGLGLNLDWLVTYLGLTILLVSSIGVDMTNQWNPPIYYGLVAAAFGIGYFILARRDAIEVMPRHEDATLERWGAYLGLIYGLGLSLRKGIKGGASIHIGQEVEKQWDHVGWFWVSIGMLICLAAVGAWLLYRRRSAALQDDVFPHAYGILWLVLIAENILAQVVTGPIAGPRASWIECTFSILYAILFFLTVVIVYHYQFLKVHYWRRDAV